VQNWENRQAVDWQYLREPEYVKGKTSLPAKFASVLVQPQGREWRRRHNEPITFGGGDLIFATCLFLALFLAFRGRIRIAEGPSGETVERFSAVERANHWVTATSFVVMALTGLVILYGQYLIKPWLGPDPYSTLAAASAYTHVAFAIPFVIGVCLMVVLWVRQNLLDKVDWNWLKRGGGFLSRKQESPPAERFNAGQKLIFWAVVLSTVILLGSGLALVFPLFWLGVVGMQWAQMIHAAIGLIMIAVIIGHIYIGTIGMEGAFGAMWSGLVDRNWAKEHHRLWYEKITGRKRPESAMGAGD
jgi:formate dehydrogenase subunit gamma